MIGCPRDKHISVDKFYTIYHMNLPEKHFSDNETYRFWELVYVIDGELTTTAGNNVYKLQKNSLILYEPSEIHTLSVDEGKYAEIFIMTFSLSGNSVNKLKLLPLSLTADLKADMYRIIDFCNPNSNMAETSFITAHHDAFLTQPLFMPKVCALTEFLLLSLCDTAPNKITPLKTKDTLLFSNITETLLNERYTFLTIDSLAKIHGVSSSKVKMLIKRYTGLPLHKYYLDLKLSQATELFREGYNVGEVSRELGFCNSNYFSFVFKRETGETPSQYIKKLKNVM